MACIASAAALSTSSKSAAAPARCSWAQIVKAPATPTGARQAPPAGAEPPADEELAASSGAAAGRPLCPAIKGTRLCLCRGRVLAVLRRHGWIEPLEPIEHPATSQNSGHVYVASQDVEGGVSLEPGDLVAFYLYVDAQGLGAEACRLMSRAAPAPRSCTRTPGPCSSFSVDAAEFVPASFATGPLSFSADADEFVPAASGAGTWAWSPDAEEFIPGSGLGGMNPTAPEFVPSVTALETTPAPGPGVVHAAPAAECGLNVLEINGAYFSDTEDEGAEAGDEAEDEASSVWSAEADEDSTAHSVGDNCIADECEEDAPAVREEEAWGEVELDDDLDVVVMCAPLKAAGRRAAASDGGSTSAGEQDDSEEEFAGPDAPLCAFRAPPGLSLLAAW